MILNKLLRSPLSNPLSGIDNVFGFSPLRLTLNFLSGPLDPRITFTRADATTCATYFDSTGLLKTVAANVPRFDYDPATLLPKGLLIEESRTNLLLQSRDMTQAAWVKADVTPLRNQVGIDGVANSACLMTEGIAGTALTHQGTSAITAGSVITGDFVVKRGNNDWILLLLAETTGTDGVLGYFNVNNGVKGSTVLLGAGASASSTMTNLGGGWYRCTLSCIPNGSYTVGRMYVRSCTADGNQVRVNNATYILDCAQLEVGAAASSFIPTAASTITRAAEADPFTTTLSTVGTIVIEHDAPSGKVLLGNGATAVITSTAPGKVALAFDNISSSLSVNGGVITSGGALSIGPTLQLLRNSTLWANSHIKSYREYNTRLPDATIRSLST